MQRSYLDDRWHYSAVVECYQQATEAEEFPLLRFVTRKLLKKTL
jgi:hypothetical protein